MNGLIGAPRGGKDLQWKRKKKLEDGQGTFYDGHSSYMRIRDFGRRCCSRFILLQNYADGLCLVQGTLKKVNRRQRGTRVPLPKVIVK